MISIEKEKHESHRSKITLCQLLDILWQSNEAVEVFRHLVIDGLPMEKYPLCRGFPIATFDDTGKPVNQNSSSLYNPIDCPREITFNPNVC